jgi:phage tail protein X
VRKLAVFATIVAIVVATGTFSKTCQAQNPWQPWSLNENKMSIEVGAKVFDRPGIDDQGPVVFDSVTNQTLITNEQASDFGSTFGAEIKINFPDRWDNQLELRTVLADWDEDLQAVGPNLASGFFPDPANTPQTFNMNLQSDFYSIELMRKRAVRPGLTIFGGPRFVSTSDSLATEGILTLGLGSITQTNTFDAKNSMAGLQGGFEVCRPLAQSVYFSGFFRGGGYHNSTKFNTSSNLSTSATVTRTRRSRSTESFIGEVGGKLHFEILPSCLASYVGYEATWIDGIALSSANVANPTGIDTANTVFFHAVTFGVNLSY